MGLFSDLESMGFGSMNMDDVYGSNVDEKKDDKEAEKEAEKPVIITEEEVLFDKSHECVVCGSKFTTKQMRDKKVKMIRQDEDLRPIYEYGIDPLKYDAILCPRCGYTALHQYFVPLTNFQIRTIKQEYCANFKGVRDEVPTMSYEGAILRHKLALMCAVKRNGKQSEKAYIFLKLAWLFRGFRESKAGQITPVVEEELKKQEDECIAKAYEGFTIAFTKEPFPMCGMDEVTLRYMMASLSYKLGRNREAVQYLAGVLSNRQVAQRVKDKALDLKEKIKKDMGLEV